MSELDRKQSSARAGSGASGASVQRSPGKRTLVDQFARRARPSASVPMGALQRSAAPAPSPSTGGGARDDPFGLHLEGASAPSIAAEGTAGGGGALPHGDAIQASFGRHDVSGVRAHVGGDAAQASAALGAEAYAIGDQVAFASTPSLHLAAHEAAHVVQQRAGVALSGGVGQAGDPYEQHADAVADKVVRGESAEALLDASPGGGAASGAAVQRKETDPADDDIYWEDPEELPDELRHDYDVYKGRLAKVNARLEELSRQKSGEGDPGAHDREVAELMQAKKALVGEINDVENDLLALENPATPAAKRNEIYAKRKRRASIDESTDSVTAWKIDEGGIGRGSSTTTTSLDDGVAKTDVASSSTTVDGSGLTHSTSKTSDEIGPDGATTKKSSRSVRGEWANPGVTVSETDTTTSKPAGGTKTSESTTTSLGVDSSGVEAKATASKTVGDDKNNTSEEVSTSTKWGRGEGELSKTDTASGTSSTTTTTKNDDGSETTRTTSTKASTSKKTGIIAGGDQGLGAKTERTGSLGKERKRHGTEMSESSQATGESSAKAGVSGSAGASFTVNVAPVDGSHPPKYRIVTTVSLNGKLGANVGASKTHGGSKAKGGVNADGHVAGAATASFSHVLTEDEANDYIAKCHKSESGSPAAGYREFAIIATAIKNPGAAVEAYNDIQAGVLSDPAAAAAMPDGEMVDIQYSHEAGVSVGAEGQSGGLKAGGKLGTSEGGKRRIRVQRSGDKVIVIIEIVDSRGFREGATGGYGAASMGYDHKESSSEGRILKIELDPNDAQFDHKYKSLLGAKELGQLDAMHDKWGGEHHAVNKESSGGTTSASVGPVGVGMVDSGGYEHTWEVDEDGNLMQNIKGHNDLGGTLSIGPVDRGSSSHEEFSAKVSADGKTATGDISDTDTTDDFGKTVGKLGDKLINDPLGLLTGATKIKEQSEHVEGTQMYDEDFDAVIAAANDDRQWMNALTSPKHHESWVECGNAIRRAKGDKGKVAEALARFTEKSGHGRDDVIREIVRDRESGTGGLRYELPDGLGHLKGKFDALAFNDPAAPVRQLAKQTTPQRAKELGEQKLAEIDGLLAELKAGHNKFEPAVYAEMMGKLQARRAALAGVLRNVDEAIENKTAYSDEGSTEEPVDAKYDRLLEFCKNQKQHERNVLAELHAHRKDGEVGVSEVTEGIALANKVRDLYKLYEPAYAELHQLALDNGIERGQYWLYKPDNARLEAALAGKDPGAEPSEDSSTERDNHQQRQQMDSTRRAINQAYSEQEKRREAVLAAIPTWTRKIDAARVAASSASWPWNKRSSEGKPMNDAMKQGYEAGRTHYQDAERQRHIYNNGRDLFPDAAAVARVAKIAIDAYAEAQKAWKAHHHVIVGK